MTKILPSDPPFTDCKVYGPYLDKKQNRKMVTLVRNDGHRTTMSYARYLLSVREGRVPAHGIDADHLDDDKTNDDPGNIQPLERYLNITKGSKPPTMVTMICGGCGQEFTRRRKDTHLAKKKHKTTSCSRKCSKAVRYGYGVALASAGMVVRGDLISRLEFGSIPKARTNPALRGQKPCAHVFHGVG